MSWLMVAPQESSSWKGVFDKEIHFPLYISEGLSLLVNKAVEESLLEAAWIWRNKVKLSHLHYADDTIFVANNKQSNATIIKWLLMNFELASGLKINFNNAVLWVGVSVYNNTLIYMVSILQCEIGSIQFSYLGIRVGINHKKNAKWEHLIHKVRVRLRSWEHKKLSLGERVIILKVVLSALSIYHLSFYYLPKKTLSEITKIQRKFLGWSDDVFKMAWIKWSNICALEEKKGRGARDLGFNRH